MSAETIAELIRRAHLQMIEAISHVQGPMPAQVSSALEQMLKDIGLQPLPPELHVFAISQHSQSLISPLLEPGHD